MALTNSARNKLFKLVQQSKKLLYQEIADQLQLHYGIFPKDGKVVLVEELTTSDADLIYTAKLLRNRLNYLAANLIDTTNKIKDSIDQLIREQAFSILNRMAALRMAEERGIVRETIGKFYNSEGFQVYDSITGQGATTTSYTRYKWYIHAIFDELALDLPSIFDRFSPYAHIFPSEKSLEGLLAIINNEDIAIHREEGSQPLNLWKQDETIGWIYQYYNSREEISAMRDASSAPRNSQELAVRNQFFTPRYVVQFLTDNSLGRIWYEMTKSKTELVSICQYLIRRQKELFLDKGQVRPENADELTDYIEHRPLKDPREILMLDPACGSMHFGLYSFDLMEVIYREAWDNYPELLTDLRLKMTRQQFLHQVPELVIRHNIHGVDIDPRALQIAALSLWLRAQKSFEKLGLPAVDRPSITRSNLVLAEAMPGNATLLAELVKPLDKPMRQLMLAIWEKMQLAGETGLLLRIENEIDETIKEIAKDLTKETEGTQLTLGAGSTEFLAAEKAALYSTKKYRDEFLANSEGQVLELLKQLSESAINGDEYQKLLFADDTARGFAFIELCRKRYDVIVMNPPFGASSIGAKLYIDSSYPTSRYDLASVFVERMLELLSPNCLLGSITTRTIFFLGSFTDWRSKNLIDRNSIKYFADLGMGVLDAMVETSAYIIQMGIKLNRSRFFRVTKENGKENSLRHLISQNTHKNIYEINTEYFKSISNEPFCYWLDKKTLGLFTDTTKFENEKRGARLALKTADNDRYVRNSWEVLSADIALSKDETLKNKPWSFFLMSDSSIRYFISIETLVYFKDNGYELRHNFNENGQLRSRPMDTYNVFYKNGLSWGFRTSKFKPHLIPHGNIATSGRCIAVFENDDQILATCSFWNSEYMDYCIKLSMERVGDPKFINGTVNQLPYPILPSDLQKTLVDITRAQYSRVKEIFRSDDKSLSFTFNEFCKKDSLKEFTDYYLSSLSKLKDDYNNQMLDLNNLIYKHFDISEKEREDINEIVSAAGNDDEGRIFDITGSELIDRIFTILVGCAFERWDIRLLKNWKQEWSNEEIFKSRSHSPFQIGQKSTTLDLIKPEYHKEIERIWHQTTPIVVLGEIATAKDLTNKLREVVNYFWPFTASTIEFELQDHFGVKELDSIFTNHNNFFDLHLNDYSRNKRVSPIYLPLSTQSGSYTLWIFYPKLNDQTLYKIVLDFIKPKQLDVEASVRKLELNTNLDNKGKSELTNLQEFLHELFDMEKEILRIASLPYKPNHDDGVLITAAPLYKLFRHNKWRNSTEECWKALEKGEYDWAHLAYAIWPDRVTKKCKKDMSMAIAHDLEKICEIKPKEKKAKAKKEPKEIKKELKLDL